MGYFPFYGGYIINNCWDSCGIFHLDISIIVEWDSIGIIEKNLGLIINNGGWIW